MQQSTANSSAGQLLTTAKAAGYLRLSQSTLNKWRCVGGGPRFVKLGRAVRYRKSDLDAYLDERSATSTADRFGRGRR